MAKNTAQTYKQNSNMNYYRTIKQRFFLILFFQSAFSLISFSQDFSDLKHMNVKGKARIITVFDYYLELEGGKPVKGKSGGKSVAIYNKVGELITKTDYKSSTKIYCKYTSKFDSKNNKIQENINYPDDSSFNSKTTYKFDNLNSLIEQNDYQQNDTYSHKQIFKYDNLGNKIEVDYYPNSMVDTFRSKSIFKYFDDGRHVEEREYSWCWQNSNGRKIIDCDENGFKYDGKKDYYYDDKKNLIEYKAYDMFGKIYSHSVNKFDYNSNLISSSDGLAIKNTYQYDTLNNEVQRNGFNNGSSLDWTVKTKYEDFDKAGNWQKETIFYDKTANIKGFIKIRKIEYY